MNQVKITIQTAAGGFVLSWQKEAHSKQPTIEVFTDGALLVQRIASLLKAHDRDLSEAE